MFTLQVLTSRTDFKSSHNTWCSGAMGAVRLQAPTSPSTTVPMQRLVNDTEEDHVHFCLKN